jgi:hypothetical protein
MKETTLKIQLSELATVRIACRKGGCRGIIELPTEELGSLSRDTAKCPLCNQPITTRNDMLSDPLCEFGRLIHRLKTMGDQFSIEFPVRVDAEKS